MASRARSGDMRNHNPSLYQLSYSHHIKIKLYYISHLHNLGFRSINLPSFEGLTLHEDCITIGIFHVEITGFTIIEVFCINCNLSLISCLYLQFQFRWTTRSVVSVSYYIGYCALTYPITPHPTGKVLLKKERGLIYCSDGEIRTHTEQVLNLLTLPVGLHRHIK